MPTSRKLDGVECGCRDGNNCGGQHYIGRSRSETEYDDMRTYSYDDPATEWQGSAGGEAARAK